MGTEEKRATVKDNTSSISDILDRDRPPEHSTNPRQAHKAHLYRSAPLTRTFLAGNSIAKVSIFSIFHLQVASAFQKKPVKKYDARCSKHIYAATQRTMWAAAMPEFECSLSEPHFDLSSRCQLAAMFVYSAREATCVITSNEVTCFDLS